MGPEELEKKASHYRNVTVVGIIEDANRGVERSSLITRAMAELSEINFGLTDEEYGQVVDTGSDKIARYERLCKVAHWLVSDGTVILYTPGEILRGHNSGWPGLTPPEETRPCLDLLATGKEEDF